MRKEIRRSRRNRGRSCGKRGTRQRILAALLCVVFLASSMSLSAQAKVEAIELEELAVPTEYPAAGVMHVQVATGKHLNGEEVEYEYQEGYLPVLVDGNHVVYGRLQTLADYLGLSLDFSGNSVKVSCYGTDIFLALNDRTAGYANSLYKVYVNMAQTPILYDKYWYVPLDAFLQLTDSPCFYYGENWLGKEEMYLVPPQRTVLDDIVDFYDNADHDYAFEYITDTGMTAEDVRYMTAASELGLFSHRFGSLKGDAWKMALVGWWGDNSNAIKHTQIDAFMDYMMTAEETVISKMLENSVSVIDGVGVFVNLNKTKAGGKVCKAVVKTLGGSRFPSLTAKYDKFLALGDEPAAFAGRLLGLAATCERLLRVDQDSLDAVKDFYAKCGNLTDRKLQDDFYRQVKKNIDSRENVVKAAPEQWFWDEIYKMAVELGDLKGISHFAEVGVFVSLWEGGTKLIAGKFLNEFEAFLQGVFGMQYEADAIAVARKDIETLLGDGSRQLSDMEKEELRRSVVHALKACYVTRYVGCQARELSLGWNPAAKERQQNRNDEIAGMMARLMSDEEVVPFGRLKTDLMNIHIQEYDHFPNVIFNICQISGQVLSWKDERPLKNVKIEVVGDDGTTLHEFKTDRNGEFDEAFELNNIDPDAQTPIQRELTLHLTYKRNPVILEYIQIQCFHSYRIEGLHAGKKTEEVIAYVNSARDEGGRTVLDISKVAIDDDTLSFDVPDWHDGTFEAYVALPGQIQVENDMESVILGEDVAIRTVYSQAAPEGSLMGGLVEFVGQTDDDIARLFQSDMHTAMEIQHFLDIYTQINGEPPAFRIKKVNSLVDSMEQVMISNGN